MTGVTQDASLAAPRAESAPGNAAALHPALRWGGRTVVVLALAVGLGLRLWYLTHAPVNSDEAIVGLMARGILHGHFVAFYWGQPYGGGGEPFVVALLFALFGQSAFVLGLAPALLSGVSAVLAWRVARRLVSAPLLAALAGALVWVGPDVFAFTSTLEYGFRGVTLVCGLACLLFALRVLDRPVAAGDAGALGLFVGIGWWSSPEIAYFLVPSGLLVVSALVRTRTEVRRWLLGATIGVLAAAVGALPWLWANARSGFASLHTSNFPGGTHSALNTGFGGRLGVFFRLALPIDVDLRRLVSGTFLVGGPGVAVLAIVVFGTIVAAVVVCVARWDRGVAIAAGVLAFPLIFAAQPGTWYWQDGRYIVFLSPLLALALVAVVEPMGQWFSAWTGRRVRPPALASLLGLAVVLGAATLSVAAFTQDNQVSPRTFTTDWSDPNHPVDQAIATLEAHGVRAGYADYWVAYKVDLLSRGALIITPAHGDVDRSKVIDQQVARARQQAWLFVPSRDIALGYTQFAGTAVIDGPRAITQANFEATLGRLGIRYRRVDAGILHAVVPARKVTIAEVLGAGA
jgi:4-amino-4-deoxy-L-arabinose transferase-like glycosyltransferase